MPNDVKEPANKRRATGLEAFFVADLRCGSLSNPSGFRFNIVEREQQLEVYNWPGLSAYDTPKKLEVIPFTRIVKILTGGLVCEKIILLLKRARDAKDDRMQLEFTSGAEAHYFEKLLRELADGEPDTLTKDR